MTLLAAHAGFIWIVINVGGTIFFVLLIGAFIRGAIQGTSGK